MCLWAALNKSAQQYFPPKLIFVAVQKLRGEMLANFLPLLGCFALDGTQGCAWPTVRVAYHAWRLGRVLLFAHVYFRGHVYGRGAGTLRRKGDNREFAERPLFSASISC